MGHCERWSQHHSVIRGTKCDVRRAVTVVCMEGASCVPHSAQQSDDGHLISASPTGVVPVKTLSSAAGAGSER